jgi:hypothetical protein
VEALELLLMEKTGEAPPRFEDVVREDEKPY